MEPTLLSRESGTNQEKLTVYRNLVPHQTLTYILRSDREAANDTSVDAVVLRIDSGGGDVVASDTIGDAIRWCQEEKKKPVIVSFGNTSASGGYFVSTHATAIVAQRKWDLPFWGGELRSTCLSSGKVLTIICNISGTTNSYHGDWQYWCGFPPPLLYTRVLQVDWCQC